MLRRNLDVANNEELCGNNAAFCCPVCRRVFVVSGFLNKSGRKCPSCNRSTGHVADAGAFIEWEEGVLDAIAPLPTHANKRYAWSQLNKLQVGAYAEYFVKMEFTMHGFQVYSPEVDDRGIDFIARFEGGQFFAIQVKSLRDLGYVFLPKSKFALADNLFLSLALLIENSAPDLYLIPSRAWELPNACFVSRDYGEGKVSAPEWGINISAKNLPLLHPYRFHDRIGTLCTKASSA
jgi:hypothetical protein